MKQAEDTKTPDMLGGVPQKRGRKPKYASSAERVAAFRARNNFLQLNVQLPADLVEALDAYMDRQNMDGPSLNKSQVIEKLLRTQLLRKR